jgi:YD repeat-containing protein
MSAMVTKAVEETNKISDMKPKSNKIILMMKNQYLIKISLGLMLFMAGTFYTSAQDCTNCFDDGPGGCGKRGFYDGDGDGFGTGPLTCFYPNSNGEYFNYARRDGDCNDSNPNIKPRAFYYDGDGDGYGVPFATFICQGSSTPPEDYTDNNNDCDDTNKDYTVERNWYNDGDGDGFGLNSTQEFGCFPSANITNPVTVGGDLNDGDATITNIPPSTFYFDFDQDGYGTNTNTEFRSEPTEGYVAQGGDCDDNNEDLHPNTVWYLDTDGDGLGVNTQQGNIVQCTMPTGNTYSLIAGDLCPTENGPITNNGCPPDDFTAECWNTVLTITYDVAGEGISKNKVYSNNLSKQVQVQSLDVQNNKVWATETMHDSHGRPTIQTLSAPVNDEGQIFYVDGILKKTDNNAYTAQDVENNSFNPPIAGKQEGSIGWYYSEQNSDEAYQDITDYPFMATEYSTLNPGQALRTIGGNKINNEWPQTYSFSMPVSQELSQSVAFGNNDYDNIKTTKTVARDVHGIENVVFVDNDGKTLAAARSGGSASRSMSIAIGPQGFVDIHVPAGTNMGFTATTNGTAITTYDLIAETTVSPNNSLPNGFYRVAVDNLESYDAGNPVTVTYHENYYDYSLNEYDESGRLTHAYQPVGATKANKPVTTYEYNTLGHLVKTTSPDEGRAEFIYREDGQIRFSQNSKQALVNDVSYTDYDSFGRPIESGVIIGANFSTLNGDSGSGNSKKEQQFTQYDQVNTSELSNTSDLDSDYHTPKFLSGNVAKTSNDQSTTYYSYDIYGRVDWLVQFIDGLGAKTIDYEYEPVRGLVEKVIYQKNQTDQFIHKYSYNERDQLTKVETSTDNSGFTLQAEYFYNGAGTLVRTELADGAQGLDYVYNLSGQLKSINHPSLDVTKDPVRSGAGDTNDLFGMQLDYHTGDYQRNNANIMTSAHGTDQLNGNIKGVRWNSANPTTNESQYVYEYDRNNWLKSADYDPGNTDTNTGLLPNDQSNAVFTSGQMATLEATQSFTLTEGFHAQSGSMITVRINANGGTTSGGDYDVTNIAYDANGNIQNLTRNAQGAMDDLSYVYKTDKPNQLLRVDDSVADNVVANVDIDDQNGDNYVYNEIGQLVRNNEENIEYLYNASGLVTEVKKTTRHWLNFITTTETIG